MPRALTSRASAGFHVRLVFRLCSTLKRLLICVLQTMAWLLKSHNGVHCCGTVGDSHSHSQLSTATCTSQGGHLCFRSALQRYNIPPNPPNKSWKKISVICHDCHDRSIMLKKLSATRGSKIFHTWSQIDISNLSARQVTDIS